MPVVTTSTSPITCPPTTRRPNQAAPHHSDSTRPRRAPRRSTDAP
ncbi:hypothetical protein E2C01_080800 [Portunus trituberculatus]|uniref:Uncharacterized protein n=1 Tax=Portunus trituberculatus TaxID=210409 RepID=A0A5B7IKK9_PORTR|nr:hypothetical protein [Portunus trituberculatus]